MKLIDILVEELPKRGGWPEGAVAITQDSDKAINNYKTSDGLETNEHGTWRHSSAWEGYSLLASDSPCLASDYDTAIITREQYEAALAASKRCDHKWIPSEGRTQSGYLCSKCGNYEGPGYDRIDWPGGECPVPTGTLVDVRYRDGEEIFSLPADDLAPSSRDASFAFWRDSAQDNDIIAYLLHKPQEAEQVKADDEANLNECIGQGAVPVWNGEGLPPVGMEIEYSFAKVNYRTDFSRGKVLAYGMQNVFMEHWASKNEFIQPLDKIEFRPILSEADRKRDAAVGKIFDVICKSLTDESESTSFAIYDAIAAGKIPGVKLED